MTLVHTNANIITMSNDGLYGVVGDQIPRAPELRSIWEY